MLPRLFAFAFFALLGALPALGLGLGELKLRSFLGQSLQAQLDLIGTESEFFNASCVRARLVTFDGAFVASVHVAVGQQANKRQLLLSTRQHINEPAVNLIVDLNCDMQLHREFSLLLDPPDLSASSTPQLLERATIPLDSPLQSLEKADHLEAKLHSAPTPIIPRKRKTPVVATPVPDAEEATLSPRKVKRPKTLEVKDVLRLSDEVILPQADQGLRMSDVLSSPTGRDLIENMQELRVAQARMAAILRDDHEAKATLPMESRLPTELLEINQLKKETEHLKKQNQIDKASLLQLQSKSSFDYWLLALSIVAILAIVVIVFLLLYIRRNFGIAKPSWWEDDEEAEISPSVRIEQAIDQLQAKFDINTGSDLDAGAMKPQAVSTGGGGAPSPNAMISDSGMHRTPTLEETNSSIFNFYSPRATSFKVEEISDVTQEAEFWISMNDPQRAIEILAAQERVDHPDSPVPWLFLLDLYRTVGDREKYDQLRQRFISFFNANIPEFDFEMAVLVSRSLDDFPHILEKICGLWSAPEALVYLESLLVDDRNGSRNGFDLLVYRDILMLIGIARELEKQRLASIASQISTVATQTKSEVDPVDEADFGSLDFEMIEFPLTDPDSKKSS